ncbi:MAG: hypothetical protein IIB94_05415 [Candidatus Marinimicrobia bacterium]|nr:hypothetical protein [Candidatus Neomarinimicrobiota bacterium]
MEEALSLYALLILSLIGFVSPILILLLSVFSTGASIVQKKSEDEKEQAEANLKDSMDKKDSKEDVNIKNIDKSLKKLKKTKRRAAVTLFYINPRLQIIFIFIPLLISFSLVLYASILIILSGLFYLVILLSILLLLYVFYSLWKISSLIIIVRQAEHTQELERQSVLLETLKTLSETTTDITLKDGAVQLDGKSIEDLDEPIKMEAHTESSLSFSITSDEKMLKTVEFGLTFPSDFIITESSHFEVFTSEELKVVRFHIENIQADTKVIIPSLKFTPINPGNYNIDLFVKGENLQKYKTKIKFEVGEMRAP